MSDRRNSAPAPRQGQRPAGQRPAGQRPAGQRPNGQRPNGQRPNGQRPANRKRAKKRSNAGFVIFLAVIALLAIIVGVIVGMGGGDDKTSNNPGNNDYTVTNQDNTQTEPQGNILTDDAGEVETVHAPILSDNTRIVVDDLHINPDLDPAWINVLLLGSDMRSPSLPFRTDTMMICSINKNTGEVKLISLMRDTAMEMNVGDQSGLYRCNVACYVGGPEYLMQFLNDKLDLNIQYYVMVDFTTFAIIADNLGGIDIPVSISEKDEINVNLRRQAIVAHQSGMTEEEVYARYFYLEEYGENVHLTGPQVLAYARIRKLDSDSARTERQRRVLIALLDKLRQKSPQEVMSLAMSMAGYITTNMTIDDIISVAIVVVSNDFQVGQLRLPENGTYVLETRDGESMLYDTDWDANRDTVHQFIYGK